MNKVQQFLLAGTLLSGVVWLQATEARVENGPSGKLALVSRPGMMLAQAQEPEPKPGVTEQKPPVGTRGKPQAVAPGRRTPPKAQGAPPAAPPAAQEQPRPAPGRPIAPPKAQSAPPAVPRSTQGQPPAVPGKPVAPPAAQSLRRLRHRNSRGPHRVGRSLHLKRRVRLRPHHPPPKVSRRQCRVDRALCQRRRVRLHLTRA